MCEKVLMVAKVPYVKILSKMTSVAAAVFLLLTVVAAEAGGATVSTGATW